METLLWLFSPIPQWKNNPINTNNPMYLASIGLHIVLALSAVSHSYEFPTLPYLNDLKELPPLHQFKNLQDLQQNMHQFLTKINYTSINHSWVIHLTDTNSLIFPEDATLLQQDHNNAPVDKSDSVSPLFPPVDWIELYGSEIIRQSSVQGIEIQTLTTVNDESARGEVAYSTGRVKKSVW